MKRYRGLINEKLQDEQYTITEVLDGEYEVTNIQQGIEWFNGCTIYNGGIIKSNYHNTSSIKWYTNNDIKLLIPKHFDRDSLHSILSILGISPAVGYGLGFWVDDTGETIKDKLDIYYFNTSNVETLRLIFRLLHRLNIRYNEQLTSVCINDAMLFIK